MTDTSLRHILKDISLFLPSFLRHPVQQIRSVPRWDWPSIIFLQLTLAVLSGVFTGAVAQSLITVVLGVLFFPILAVLVTVATTAFLNYALIYLYNARIETRRLYHVLVLAFVPFMFLRILAPVVPPVELVGFAMTSLLLAVGLADNFQLPKAGVLKLVGTLFLIFFTVWIWVTIATTKKESLYRSELQSSACATESTATTV